MAMRNHTGHSDLSARLTTLLRRIRDGLDRSLGSLRKAAAGSELPHVHVNDEDVKCAVMYLHDVGLKYDGLRLHSGFARLRNRCMDECFASMADGEPQEYRDKLAELFGPFPSQGNPSDLVVADRRVTLLGCAAQLSEFVDDLLGTITASSEMMKSQPANPASGDSDGLLDTGNGYEKKFYEYDSEVRRCAREFIKVRDDGSMVTRENHCKEFADKPEIKKSASTLQKAMTQHRNKWDPDKKYGRPKKKRS